MALMYVTLFIRAKYQRDLLDDRENGSAREGII